MDDEIYNHFRSAFPDFDVTNVNEDSMKSSEGKEKWRYVTANGQEDYSSLQTLNIDLTHSPLTPREGAGLLCLRVDFMSHLYLTQC